MSLTTEQEIEDLELDLLMEGLTRRYGLDLRGHARASLRRRIESFRADEKLATFSQVQDLVLRDPEAAERLSQQLSVTVTSFFRDPGLYRHLREDVVPDLRTWPSIRVWVAGCATGEEAMSVAMLLDEEGLGERSRIHATDRNRQALAIGRSATHPLSAIREAEAAYVAAGGEGSVESHCIVSGDQATFKDELRRMITYSVHDLAVDGRFNEFHLILCRNVLIYFKDPLKRRVMDLVHASLAPYGVLVLGSRENLDSVSGLGRFTELSRAHRTYRRASA